MTPTQLKERGWLQASFTPLFGTLALTWLMLASSLSSLQLVGTVILVILGLDW